MAEQKELVDLNLLWHGKIGPVIGDTRGLERLDLKTEWKDRPDMRGVGPSMGNMQALERIYLPDEESLPVANDKGLERADLKTEWKEELPPFKTAVLEFFEVDLRTGKPIPRDPLPISSAATAPPEPT